MAENKENKKFKINRIELTIYPDCYGLIDLGDTNKTMKFLTLLKNVYNRLEKDFPTSEYMVVQKDLSMLNDKVLEISKQNKRHNISFKVGVFDITYIDKKMIEQYRFKNLSANYCHIFLQDAIEQILRFQLAITLETDFEKVVISALSDISKTIKKVSFSITPREKEKQY